MPLIAAAVLGCASGNDRIVQLEERVARLDAQARQTPPLQDTARSPAVSEDGWLISGGGRDVYTVQEDTRTQRDGHGTLLLAPSRDTNGKYGTWMRSIDAAPYRGKRVRLSAYTKTEGATKRADFWGRVQAADSPGDGSGLGGQWMRLPATSDWARTEIVLDVGVAGAMLQYGVGVAGPGRIWVDSPRLEIVGSDVAVTHGQ